MRARIARDMVWCGILGIGLLLMGSSATALDKCKVKVDKKDGTLLVKANDVNGQLLWGTDSQNVVAAFSNEATCLSGGKAKNCTLGDAATPERVVPPPLCTLYLADTVGSCSAYIKGCVPGSRPTCPPDTERIGGWCIDLVALPEASWFSQIAACKDKGRSLCPLEALFECDEGQGLGTAVPGTCGEYTDSPSTPAMWTLSSDAVRDENWLDGMMILNGDNTLSQDARDALYSGFCCLRAGGL